MNLLFLASAEVFKRRKGNSPFLGEVLASDFITGAALAQAVGLTAGTLRNSDEPWLKFKDPIDGKIKYIAKKFIRTGVSWNMLSGLLVVTGKTISINGQMYRVRLPKTLPDGVNTAVAAVGFDHPVTHGSEWNRLMYHISGKPFTDARNTLASEGIEEGDWATYSETDLNNNQYHGICQEKSNDGYAFLRGETGVSYVTFANASNAYYAWRPVLELIE
ncbi:hypothetical protein D3C85_15930 [compost metagenome]